MNKLKKINERFLMVAGFSFLFAYILSFLFEGQVLYRLLDYFRTWDTPYVFSAIIAHFFGLFSCGFFFRPPSKTAQGVLAPFRAVFQSPKMPKYIMAGGMLICLFATIPFFFPPSAFWFACLLLAGYAAGCAVAAWGYFLKTYAPKNQRIKFCADVLILSNLLMIAINTVAMNGFPFVGLVLSMLCLILGAILIGWLPSEAVKPPTDPIEQTHPGNLKKPILVLSLFVAAITINSGLMYQVINPAFEHLTGLVSWYWAVPYIIALAFMRNLPKKAKRSLYLYLGMGMIMAAFITFMLLGRNRVDYLVVDTLMLGACGIFDLFWWSILGEMLDHTENPIRVFGIGLSANVIGVLLGDAMGVGVTSIQLSTAEVTVIALTVVCITLIILPPLNRQLLILLKSHTYLKAYEHMTNQQQTAVLHQIKTLHPLTEREQEVLQFILSGKPNKAIAKALFISENTVKTHARNIYSKYDVSSRAELISTLLKNQTDA